MKNQKYPEMGGLYQIVEKQKKKVACKVAIAAFIIVNGNNCLQLPSGAN